MYNLCDFGNFIDAMYIDFKINYIPLYIKFHIVLTRLSVNGT